ncbi:unnamed protein product [Penicillium glandicola]
MASLMKKFKRKRRVSTELHSRWGSWNQWNQASGFVADGPARANIQSEENQQYLPASPLRQASSSASSRRSRNTGTREHQVEDSPSFPTGYFDQNIRRRTGDTHTPPAHTTGQGLGLGDLMRGPHRRPSGSIINDECTTDESCDEEEEEERDTLGPRIELSPREYGMADVSYTPRDHTEDFDIPAKSPPLSVTSRMRCSLQSCATDPAASISGTNSRRTSYTAASSISAPSMPPSTPRVAYNTPKQPSFPEKRYPPRIKPREPEPAPQEMVPSYDELYG